MALSLVLRPLHPYWPFSGSAMVFGWCRIKLIVHTCEGYQSAAPMCESGRLVHIPGSQGCLLPNPCLASEQDVSLLNGGCVRVTVPAIRLLPGPAHLLKVCGDGVGYAQGKRVLLVLSNSEEAARRDSMP